MPVLLIFRAPTSERAPPSSRCTFLPHVATCRVCCVCLTFQCQKKKIVPISTWIIVLAMSNFDNRPFGMISQVCFRSTVAIEQETQGSFASRGNSFTWLFAGRRIYDCFILRCPIWAAHNQRFWPIWAFWVKRSKVVLERSTRYRFKINNKKKPVIRARKTPFSHRAQHRTSMCPSWTLTTSWCL